MPDIITREIFASMIAAAARRVREHQAELCRLDSHGGDGDHGTTMARAMSQAEQAATKAGGGVSALLKDAGWAVMGIDGGATGPLFGTLFTKMAAAAGDSMADSAALANVFESGLAGVRKRSKAAPGDKTLVDALAPAVEALRAAADQGASIPDALDAAARAAQEGAEATRDMQARFGRAKHLGEGSIGEPDPGATSMAYLFAGFAEGVKGHA